MCLVGQSELSQLSVKCNNVEKGCIWVGTVGTVQDHMPECDFSLFRCPNECKKDGKLVMVMKKDLEEHISTACPYKNFTCLLCGKKGKFDKNEHDEVCPNKIVDCPNMGCFETMERKKIISHMNSDCKFAEVSCRYKNLGCNVRKVRMYIKKHEEDIQIHFNLAMEKIDELDQTISALEEETVTILNKSGLYTFRLENFNFVHRNNEKFSSQPFYTRPGGYKMIIRVHTDGYAEAKGSHISMYAKLIRGRNDAALSWPFVGSVTFELLNQLEDSNHYRKVLDYEESDNAQVNSGWGYTNFLPHSLLAGTDSTQYLENDSLVFRVTVKERSFKPWLDCPCAQ